MFSYSKRKAIRDAVMRWQHRLPRASPYQNVSVHDVITVKGDHPLMPLPSIVRELAWRASFLNLGYTFYHDERDDLENCGDDHDSWCDVPKRVKEMRQRYNYWRTILPSKHPKLIAIKERLDELEDVECEHKSIEVYGGVDGHLEVSMDTSPGSVLLAEATYAREYFRHWSHDDSRLTRKNLDKLRMVQEQKLAARGLRFFRAQEREIRKRLCDSTGRVMLVPHEVLTPDSSTLAGRRPNFTRIVRLDWGPKGSPAEYINESIQSYMPRLLPHAHPRMEGRLSGRVRFRYEGLYDEDFVFTLRYTLAVPPERVPDLDATVWDQTGLDNLRGWPYVNATTLRMHQNPTQGAGGWIYLQLAQPMLVERDDFGRGRFNEFRFILADGEIARDLHRATCVYDADSDLFLSPIFRTNAPVIQQLMPELPEATLRIEE